jgi:hypothetical protein
MGCWNGTCFLSNLSIRAGDRVKLQLLMPTCGQNSRDVFDLDKYDENTDPREINGITYVCDDYEPFAPVITGEYNDYGSIEKVKEDGNLSFIKSFIKDLEKKKEILSLQTVDKWIGRNRESKEAKKGIDATIPIKINDIEKFIDMVERGSIVVKSCYGGWRRLRFVMMHEDIYNESLKSVSKWKDWHGKNIATKQKIKQQQIVDFYTKGIFPPNEDGEVIAPDKASAPMIRMLLNETIWEDFNYSENTVWYKNYLSDFCNETKDVDIINNVISNAFDNLNINNFLGALRKPWALTGGSGSQDDNEKEVKNHSKVISKFIIEHKKELEARYGE